MQTQDMQNGKKFFLNILLALALLVSLAGYGHWYYTADGQATREKLVYIKPGTGFSEIVVLLEQKQVLRFGWLFTAIERSLGKASRYQAGEYLFTARMSPQEISNLIRSGQTYKRKITLPEGLNSYDFLSVLQQTAGLTGDMPRQVLEGSLLPDTYFYSYGDTYETTIGRMQQALLHTLNRLWDARAEGLPLKSKAEAVILASIVEKETGMADERGLVASVFINRLNQGMPLQSDPTVVYALTRNQGASWKGTLTRSDLQTDSPYNTYVYNGLPPGAICFPGAEALVAVLNPPSSDYLFFVADGRGGHRFAKTLDEHNANVEAWRALRAQEQ